MDRIFVFAKCIVESKVFKGFILIAAVIIMNLFIGIIMNSMEESMKELTLEFQEIMDKDKIAVLFL